MRNIFLVLAAVAILRWIEVHAASIPDDQPKCDVYQDVQMSWYECHTSSDTVYLEDPLRYAEHQCWQKDTAMACMRDAFASCDNIDDIMAVIGATFSYCNGNTLETVFANYIAYEYTKQDDDCAWTIARSGGECVIPALEPFENGTLSFNNGLQQAYKLVTTVVSCLGPIMKIPAVPECGMESGLKAVMDFLVTMTIGNIVGSATYDRFLALLLQQHSNTWVG